MLSARTNTSESKREKSKPYLALRQIARAIILSHENEEDRNTVFWEEVRSNHTMVTELAFMQLARILSEEKNAINKEIARNTKVWDKKRRKGLAAFGWMLPHSNKPIGDSTAGEVLEAAQYYEKQGEATAAAFAEKAKAMRAIYQRVVKSGKIFVKDAISETQLSKLLPS